MKNFRRTLCIILSALFVVIAAGCSGGNSGTPSETVADLGDIITGSADIGSKLPASDAASAITDKMAPPPSVSLMDTEFTARDKDIGYEQSTATVIELNGSGAKITGSGAESSDGDVIITAEGSYVISGKLNDGTIFIDAPDIAKVQLVFNGAEITCSDFAAIFVKKADKVFITLNEGTVNKLSDSASYVLTEQNSYVDGEQVNVDGLIFSRCDISFNGSGSLILTAGYKHAIVTKDDLVITDGSISISSVGGGLYGRDSVKICGGTISVSSGSDGIQADNNTKSEKGFVYIGGGNISISSASDGIQAETVVFIDGGTTLISAAKESVKCGAVAVVTGGTLAGMSAEEFDCPVSTTSEQNAVLLKPVSALAAGDSISVVAHAASASVADFNAAASAQFVFFTSPDIDATTEYMLYKG